MQTTNYPAYDLDKIERDAREMRAEVVANGVKYAFSRAKSLFSARPKGEHQPG